MTAHEFLWMDLETSGLDPRTGSVLEYAVVLCEDAAGDDLEIVSEYSSAIHTDLANVFVDRVVLRMHRDNGLWADVRASDVTLEESDAQLTTIAQSLGASLHSITLAGNSVHFDLAWCRVRFPSFAQYLSHRVFDVSTLRRACETWFPHARHVWPRSAHRALPDVIASIETARIAREIMRGER
jgi:oligoribonuclease